MEKGNYWICIAGPVDHGDLRDGADNPPRRAVIKAIEGMGHEVESYYTGWGANEQVAEQVQKAWNGQRVYTESEVRAMMDGVKAIAADHSRKCYTNRIEQMTPPTPVAFHIDNYMWKTHGFSSDPA